MKKLKVMAIVGTRPELIRLSRVLARLDQATDLVLVHTGQNYDYSLNDVFFEELGIRRPDHFLAAASPGSTAIDTIGQTLMRVDPVLEAERPDAVLILGDTNSCLSAIACKRRKIPVFHMEAGNRCFDERVPEELNRRIVDHISDINLPYSDLARDYLLREALPPDRVIKTGSPMHEVLHHYLPRIEASDVLTRLELHARDYFVVSLHREENVDPPAALERIAAMLDALARKFRQRIIFSTHPRTRNRLAHLAHPEHAHRTARRAHIGPLLPDTLALLRFIAVVAIVKAERLMRAIGRHLLGHAAIFDAIDRERSRQRRVGEQPVNACAGSKDCGEPGLTREKTGLRPPQHRIVGGGRISRIGHDPGVRQRLA